jgi:CHAT domain-containing protein
VQQGLTTIRAAAPRSRAEGHLLLTLAQVQRQQGRVADSLVSGRAAIDIFADQRESPGLPGDVADEHLAALYEAWRANPSPQLADEFFETVALVWDGAAARSAAQLAARLASGEAAAEARAFQDAERAYRAALARRQRIASAPEAATELIAEAETQVKERAEKLQAAEAALRSRSPRFLELSAPRVRAEDLRGVLGEGEGYVRFVTSSTGSYGVLVTGAEVRPFRVALNETQANELANRVRETSAFQGRRLPDFDVEAAANLYRELLGPVEPQLAQLQRIQIDAPGALAAVPYAALLTATPDEAAKARIVEDQDYTGAPWLARKLAVASSVGPAAFVRVRKTERPQRNLRAAAYADFSPAPSEVAKRLASLRGLSDRCRVEMERALVRLPALPTTSEEAQETATLFGQGTRVRLGDAFTDQDFFGADEVENSAVIMLATHGVLGLSDCFPEPALLTSVGEKGDGLIEASELLDKKLSAELVVLSACDTAGGGRFDIARTGFADGGEALSGLARGFLYAGAASVLATQWQVDAVTSSEEVRRFFAAALNESMPLAQALQAGQAQLYEVAETAHPFYWAGLVLIGDGGARLGQPDASTRSAATQAPVAGS